METYTGRCPHKNTSCGQHGMKYLLVVYILGRMFRVCVGGQSGVQEESGEPVEKVEGSRTGFIVYSFQGSFPRTEITQNASER